MPGATAMLVTGNEDLAHAARALARSRRVTLWVVRGLEPLPKVVRTVVTEVAFIDRGTIDAARALAVLDSAPPSMLSVVPNGYAATLHALDVWSAWRRR